MQYISPCVAPSLFSALKKEWDGSTPCFFFRSAEDGVHLYPVDTISVDFASDADGYIDSQEISLNPREGVDKYRQVLKTYQEVLAIRQAAAKKQMDSVMKSLATPEEEPQAEPEESPKADSLRDIANQAFKVAMVS